MGHVAMPGRRKLSPSSMGSAQPVPFDTDAPQAAAAPVPLHLHPTPGVLSGRFTAADLAGQFVLSRSEDTVPNGWIAHRLQGWTLASHPWLPVITLRAVDGCDVGWLLGDPINETATFLRDIVALPFDRHAPAAQMEAWLARLCGRYLAIWLTPIYERAYPDAGGLLSAVFAPDHGMLASTISLIPYSRGCDENLELVPRGHTGHVRTALGFGLTPRNGVARLQPNHYLDLNRWKAQRHWPVAPLDEPCDPADAVITVSRMIHRHVAAGLRRGNVLMALTAGMDSRAILACSREEAKRLQFMTLAIPDQTGRLDVEIATRLAAIHGLSHRVLEHTPPVPGDLDQWLWRTGSCVSEPRGWRAWQTYGQLGAAAEVTGAGGEAARVGYWRDSGSGKHPLTPEILAECIDVPPTPTVLSAARTWMDTYPASTPVQLLDGFYLENSLGVTAGALAYGDAPHVRCRLYPYVNRASLDAMMRLPERYRLERRFQRDLIRVYWPELLRTPFNRKTGVRHHVYRARRRFWLWRHSLAGTRNSR